jgi:hypothetical protein
MQAAFRLKLSFGVLARNADRQPAPRSTKFELRAFGIARGHLELAGETRNHRRDLGWAVVQRKQPTYCGDPLDQLANPANPTKQLEALNHQCGASDPANTLHIGAANVSVKLPSVRAT